MGIPFDPSKIKSVYGLIASFIVVVGAICIALIKHHELSIGTYIIIGISFGLIFLISLLIYRFLINNPQVIWMRGEVNDHSSRIKESFQEVNLGNLISELEQLKQVLIEHEEWDKLQKIDAVLRSFNEGEKSSRRGKPSRFKRDGKQMDLNLANQQLTELLNQIRK